MIILNKYSDIYDIAKEEREFIINISKQIKYTHTCARMLCTLS